MSRRLDRGGPNGAPLANARLDEHARRTVDRRSRRSSKPCCGSRPRPWSPRERVDGSTTRACLMLNTKLRSIHTALHKSCTGLATTPPHQGALAGPSGLQPQITAHQPDPATPQTPCSQPLNPPPRKWVRVRSPPRARMCPTRPRWNIVLIGSTHAGHEVLGPARALELIDDVIAGPEEADLPERLIVG